MAKEPDYNAPILCLDCHQDLAKMEELFIFDIKVWNKAVGRKDRHKFLCVGCLEDRLGRRLRPEEFPDCEENTTPCLFRSHRLIDRMTWLRDYW
jgi:hypothetical protein